MPFNRQQLAQLLQGGVAGGASGENPYQAAEAQGINQKASDDRAAALKKYLLQQEPVVAGQKQAAQNTENLKSLRDPDLQDMLNQGGSAKVGDISVGADPYAHRVGQLDKGEDAARNKALQLYSQGLTKIQPMVQAATEGLNFANDPKNIGSLGQARTLMLKAMGMNRYNENEAAAVLPQSLQGKVAGLFNAAGGDMAPLNEVQRSSVNEFFKGQLETAQMQHEMLKQNAMSVYNTSRYADPQRGQMLGQAMGAPMTQSMQTAQAKYKQVPATQGPNLTSQPNPGMADILKSLLGMGGSKPAAPQDGTMRVRNKETGQMGTVPASEFDPNLYEQVQ